MNKILIVEDEKIIREGIQSMIERMPMHVGSITQCSNGQAALDIIIDDQIDLVITDIHMPVMNGIALVKEIKKLNKSPEIVVLSGYDEFDYAVQMFRSGVREYLLKPVERNQLQQLLLTIEAEITQRHNETIERQHIYGEEIKWMLLEDNRETPSVVNYYRKYIAEKVGTPYRVMLSPETDSFLHDSVMNMVIITSFEGSNLLIISETDYAQNCYGNVHYAGFSTAQTDVDNLKNAYCEALEVRRRAYIGQGKKCRKNHVIYDDDQGVPLPIIDQEEIEKISYYLGTDRYIEIEKMLKLIFSSLLSDKISFVAYSKTIQKLVNEINANHAEGIMLQQNQQVKLKPVLAYPTHQVMMQTLMPQLESLDRFLKEDYEQYKNKKKIIDAKHYIDENFQHDINMAVVSNFVSMNYSLFSHSFKEHVSMNFNHYLRHKRIDYAKKLLLSTDYLVNEISQRAGFNDYKHFLKSFKKITGVSPSDYRK